MPNYDLSPRDVALYQRSNEYLSRLNALDPYSREYANVYNDYVDTIDQLSNRDFRTSLNPTLLEFAPMTRPRVQPRASEPVQQPSVSAPVQVVPTTSSGSLEYTPRELASMYQNSMNILRAAPTPKVEPQTQEVTPYGITVSSPDWDAYLDAPAKSQSQPRNKNHALSFINTTDGPFGPVVPFLQAARTYAQRNSSKGQATAPTQWRPVYFGLDATARTPPYARALSELSSWIDEGI